MASRSSVSISKTANEDAACARIKALYYIMQTIERNVGGGEGLEGLYGSVTRTGMQKVLDCLVSNCGLDAESHFVDVGAGLGRPILHALVHPGVASGFGIELDSIKCQKAEAFLERTVRELSRKVTGAPITAPLVHCLSVEEVATLEPATHAYSFWEGVPAEGRYAFGRLFSQSQTLQSVAVVQRAMRSPVDEMEEFGFGRLALEASFPVSMSGSGRSFTAYVFNRLLRPQLPRTPAAADKRRDSIESAETCQLLLSAQTLTFPIRAPAAVELDLAAQPATPSLARRKAGQVGSVTPMSRSRIDESVTPKSSGISGAPRRVLREAANPTRLAMGTPTTSAKQSSRHLLTKSSSEGEEKANNKAPETRMPPASSAPALPRKSSRLAARTSVQPVSSVVSPKTGKGVQKAKSPKKSATLDAVGLRSRRTAAAGKANKATAAKKLQLEPKGLARAQRA